MKASLAVAVLLPTLALAQVPAQVPANQTIGYQGRLLKKDGSPVTGKVDAMFRIYDKDSTELWKEPQSVTPNPQGYAVFLGSVAAFQATLFNGSDDRWLGITLAGDSELIPRQKIASVAYALMASGVANNTVGTAQLADGAVTASKLKPAEAWNAPELLNWWKELSAGSGLYTVGYYRDAVGDIHIRGMMYGGNSLTVALALPAGYRPATWRHLPSVYDDGTGTWKACLVRVDPGGNVVVAWNTGTPTWVSLDVSSFRAEP